MKELIVRGAPQEYECQTGAWQKLPAHLSKRNIKRVLILHGEQSWEAAQPYLPSLAEFTTYAIPYGGECSDKQSIKLTSLIQEKNIEAIVAVGGGKVADLGKLTAYNNQIAIIILPTLAATCAAYTSLSVVYHEDGSMDRYDIFPTATTLVLIEPEIILHSPIDLMIAGIGDTLAKWYEAEPMIDQLDTPAIEIQVAAFAAKKARDILLKDSAAALIAMENKQLNQAFLNILETNILLAGMVGGFGDDYGRTSGAHSIHDALTILPNCHQNLHGNIVAYGILVQLIIEKKHAEILRLLPFYQQLGLPSSLQQLNLQLSDTDYQRVAKRATLPDETIHFLKEEITPQLVSNAMKELEALVNNGN
ncbi:iron-containing alcohol dehydrogenase family protein [Enterococcus saccharolyticus]|uniref:Glycerol dehydrogenase n=1 Tax=Candidatus Enterococcus willemsii TaxID=1857215 RepID=A0ABQ6YVM3_9ENTE|nr:MULTISPECIES: iron-containing alcohol dehydrogenase family protein [Enterococcus]KAF1301196.1 glycerol dehydrogenase [Enterococcus sp. CU12B]MCD5000898.1 iron-containing alcohol dehydrogenase family protein [Enterococcus saccharolyticus]